MLKAYPVKIKLIRRKYATSNNSDNGFRQLIKRRFFAGCQWPTPIILATQEAEMRRIAVQSQPGQIVYETISKKSQHKKGLVEWLKCRP
jgi:hypothetical protein